MHGDAVLRQIERQRLRQPHAAELGGAVAGVVLAADLAGLGVDLNDAPGDAVADHQARELAGAEEIAHQVHLQRAVEVAQREVGDRRRLGDAGAVHQQVGLAECPVNRRRQRDHALFVGGIGLKTAGAACAKRFVDLLCHLIGIVGVQIGHRQPITGLRQPVGQKGA